MALPIAGSWIANNANANDYVGALKWGTGNNPIHEIWGEGPPLNRTGRQPGPSSADTPNVSVPDSLTFGDGEQDWGYTMEDIGTQIYSGMTPEWGETTNELRSQNEFDHPDWEDVSSDPVVTDFRRRPEMSNIIWSGTRLDSFPTETVSEGWLNKEAGKINDAEVSDPVQYERQTSMQQVNPAAGRNNGAAQLRATDDPRSKILTRLVGMKIKPWSQGKRNEDMFPYQQDSMVRPFWYRTAGTDDPAKLAPNEMYVSDPIQRDVPPDPYLGPLSSQVGEGDEGNYGWTPEDMQYNY